LSRAYPAHDLAAASTLADHVACASTHFPTRHTAWLATALAQQLQHRFDTVRNDGIAVQHICDGLDILILTAQCLAHELVPKLRQVDVELATCSRQCVEGIEIDGASDFLDDAIEGVVGLVTGCVGKNALGIHIRIAAQGGRKGIPIRILYLGRFVR
jgi:hypothetical protein